MHNPLLEDITIYLTNLGLVEGDGIDTFRDFTPEEPDNIVVLQEYKGDGTVHYDDITNRSVQIAVRNTDADTARQKALEILKALKSDTLRVDFTPDRWGLVSIRQCPIRIGTDGCNRVKYAFNIGVTTTLE